MPIDRSALLAALLLYSVLQAGEPPAPELKVEASGLRIVAPQPDQAVQAFSWKAGTTVALLVQSQSGGLIQFESAHSVVSRFTDDKGEDLLTRRDPAREEAGFSYYPKIAEDGKSCALEIVAPKVPSKGATSIQVQGVISLLAARTKIENEQKDVPLRNAAKVTVGALELKIDKLKLPDKADEPLTLAFLAQRELDEVAEIRFYRKDGTEIKSRKVGHSLMALIGQTTVEWHYELSEKVDSATIKVFTWSDLKRQKAPFSLQINLGL